MSERLNFVKGVMRAVKRGNLFPASTRMIARDAPGGSRMGHVQTSFGNELFRLQINEHTFPVAGLSEPLRVLQISDVHLRQPDDWLKELTDRIASLTADIVVLTGDLITRGWSEDAVDLLLSSLPQTRLGTYAVMGNWEYWGGVTAEQWERLIAPHGVRLLQDQAVDLGPLQLVGTDDYLAGKPDLDKSFVEINPERPTVVLTHSPGLFPQLCRPGVRLVLSGHTHGGQIRLPLMGALFLPRGSGAYPYGWYEHGGTWLYVSRGIGWSVAPLRLGAIPEVSLIQLVPG